jgi:signal transduction histidine kinase
MAEIRRLGPQGMRARHRNEEIASSEILLVVAVVGAFAVLGAFPARLDLRRHAVVVAVDGAVLVAAIFELPGPTVVAGAAAGVALANLLRREPLRRALLAVPLRGVAAGLAVAGVSLLGATDRHDPVALFVAVVVVVAAVVAENVASAALVALRERAPLAPVLARIWIPTVLLHLGTTPLGVVALVLADRNPLLPLLLGPVVVAVVASGRALAERQAERLRVVRLLQASTKTAELRSFTAALTVAAEQAQGLTTGVAGVCCAPDLEGRWVGIAVDDQGARALDEDAVAAMRQLTIAGTAVELDMRREMLPTRLALPPARVVFVAAAAPDAATELIIAGFRDRTSGASGPTVELMADFVPLAALGVANARLYEEVDAAYRRELDLNRQKGEFVATVSHELRTPVAAMMGTIETVSRLAERLDDRKRAALLSGALDHGERLTRVIEELLLVAATEQSAAALHVDDIDVEAMLGRVVATTSAVAEGRVVAVVSPEITRLQSDEHKLFRILVNLIENAAKYAPDGPIELEAIAGGDKVLFFVTDHGPGISRQDRQRVFERFVQLDQSLTRRRGGLGLGLHLCRQLAELLGGELVLTETPGGGCSFCLAVSRQVVQDGGEVETSAPSSGLRRRPVPAA